MKYSYVQRPNGIKIIACSWEGIGDDIIQSYIYEL